MATTTAHDRVQMAAAAKTRPSGLPNPDRDAARREIDAVVEENSKGDQDFISHVLERRDSGIEHNKAHAADVFRTLCFMYGQQNVLIDDKTLKPYSIKPKGKKKFVYDNRLKPTFEYLKSEYFKNLPVMTAHGAGMDLADAKASKVASRLSSYWRDMCGWLQSEREACNWMLVSGAAFLAPVWRKNPLSPTTITTYEFREDPVAAFDPSRQEEVLTWLEEKKTTTFKSGLQFDVFTTLNTFCFPLSADTWGKVEEVYTIDLVTKDYIERYLGKKVNMDGISPAQPEDINMGNIEKVNRIVGNNFSLIDHNTDTDRYIFMQVRQRPTFANPDGVYAIFIGDKLIHKDKLPYVSYAREVDPLDTENISMGIIPWFAYDEPGRLIPESPIGRLIPAQVQYNCLLSDQATNRRAIGRNRIFYEEGSLDDADMTSEHGEMIKVRTGATNMPSFHQGRVLEGIQLEIEAQKARVDEASGRTEALSGSNPAQVRSAFHLDILIERAQIPLEDRIRERELHAKRVFWLSAAMFRRKAPAQEILDIYGPSREPEVVTFLLSNFRNDMTVTEGSARPVNKASQEAKIIEMVRYGLFRDKETGEIDEDTVLDMMEMGKALTTVNVRRRTRTLVETENYRMLGGVVVAIDELEDHQIHIQEHGAFMATHEYVSAPPEIRSLFVFHFQEHQRMLMMASPEGAMTLQSEDAAEQAKMLQSGQLTPDQVIPEDGLPGLVPDQ